MSGLPVEEQINEAIPADISVHEEAQTLVGEAGAPAEASVEQKETPKEGPRYSDEEIGAFKYESDIMRRAQAGDPIAKRALSMYTGVDPQPKPVEKKEPTWVESYNKTYTDSDLPELANGDSIDKRFAPLEQQMQEMQKMKAQMEFDRVMSSVPEAPKIMEGNRAEIATALSQGYDLRNIITVIGKRLNPEPTAEEIGKKAVEDYIAKIKNKAAAGRTIDPTRSSSSSGKSTSATSGLSLDQCLAMALKENPINS